MQSESGTSLAQVLRVKRGDVVCFVGGGGKTTSMFRLAGELARMGWRVVMTTTTHISQEQARTIAAKLLASPSVDTVVIGSMLQDPLILEAWTCDL